MVAQTIFNQLNYWQRNKYSIQNLVHQEEEKPIFIMRTEKIIIIGVNLINLKKFVSLEQEIKKLDAFLTCLFIIII